MNFFETTITEEAKALARNCLEVGWVSEGGVVEEFENKISETFGYQNCVAVNSCTSALHLALILAGVKPGDEVILPAQTFVATGMAVLYCGARPVFVDIDRQTGNISSESFWKTIDDRRVRIHAIISVSWGGTSQDKDFFGYCKALGIPLIQDNAHALGSDLRESDFACYSFQAVKQLTTGDGGMLVCKNPHDAYRAKKLRWFGIDRESKTGFDGERVYDLYEVGYKYQMNNIAAAIGLGNLHGIKERQARRKWIADQYDKAIGFDLVNRDGSSDWLYTALILDRDKFIRHMRSRNIPVSVVHNGIDRNPVFGGVDRSLVNQRYWDEHHICLPCHSGMTDEDVQKVTEAIHAGW